MFRCMRSRLWPREFGMPHISVKIHTSWLVLDKKVYSDQHCGPPKLDELAIARHRRAPNGFPNIGTAKQILFARYLT
jgi:hypothetical protein